MFVLAPTLRNSCEPKTDLTPGGSNTKVGFTSSSLVHTEGCCNNRNKHGTYKMQVSLFYSENMHGMIKRKRNSTRGSMCGCTASIVKEQKTQHKAQIEIGGTRNHTYSSICFLDASLIIHAPEIQLSLPASHAFIRVKSRAMQLVGFELETHPCV